MVEHACNPSYSGDGDQEDLCSRSTQEKELARQHLNRQARYGCTCPSYKGGTGRKNAVQGWPNV
jgi:hypothetical protein